MWGKIFEELLEVTEHLARGKANQLSKLDCFEYENSHTLILAFDS